MVATFAGPQGYNGGIGGVIFLQVQLEDLDIRPRDHIDESGKICGPKVPIEGDIQALDGWSLSGKSTEEVLGGGSGLKVDRNLAEVVVVDTASCLDRLNKRRQGYVVICFLVVLEADPLACPCSVVIR